MPRKVIARAASYWSGSPHQEEQPQPDAAPQVVEPVFTRNPFENPDVFDREIFASAHVFGSECCRAEHFLLPLFTFWCRKIGCPTRFHRKLWEFVYILQTLQEHGCLRADARGLGIAPAETPLPDYFSGLGTQITLSSLDMQSGNGAGGGATDHSALTKSGIPDDLRGFDFCWSTCTMAHLGSIEAGKQFLAASLQTLRPGGLSVHITEYNVKSNAKTMDNRGTVIFRKRDLQDIAREMRLAGHEVAPLNFYSGSHVLDHYVDLPPYRDDPHLKLLVLDYTVTSFGIAIQKAAVPVS